jgi:transcriptional antiterminator RfaH
MQFWCAAKLVGQREALALHCLGLAGFETYAPRLREHRSVRGRKIVRKPLLFPGYCFVWIELQWHAARWSPGVVSLIMGGDGPARVPDHVIAEIRSRERDGLIELPKPPALKPGDRVRITAGAFGGHLALYQGQTAHERVAVPLRMLGGQHRAVLPANAIEPIGEVAP